MTMWSHPNAFPFNKHCVYQMSIGVPQASAKNSKNLAWFPRHQLDGEWNGLDLRCFDKKGTLWMA